MKGRGTRVCSLDELRLKGSPSAKFAKDHFIIMDAVGVERSQKTDARPLERTPGLSFKQVLEAVSMSAKPDEDLLSTLAGRLIRLDKQLNEREKQAFSERAAGKTISQAVRDLLGAHDADALETIRQKVESAQPTALPAALETAFEEAHEQAVRQAIAIFDNPDLREFLLDVRKKYDQIIDTINLDELIRVGPAAENEAAAAAMVDDFKSWLAERRDEMAALQLFYGQPQSRRELTFQMIRQLADALKMQKPNLAPLAVWRAFERLEKVVGQPKNELTALVAVVRRSVGIDAELTLFEKTVARNFQDWTMQKQAGATKFSHDQMHWLHLIRDHAAISFHLDRDDFADNPAFFALGGLGRFRQLFGGETDRLIDELNEALAA